MLVLSSGKPTNISDWRTRSRTEARSAAAVAGPALRVQSCSVGSRGGAVARATIDDGAEAMGDNADLVVQDAPERERYEAWVGDRLAGYLEYSRNGDAVVLLHTEVKPQFEGGGVGAALARTALDEARGAGLRVNPQCPFVARWIARHLEYLDAVPQQWRDRITRATR